jgi:N-carbamoyl-L-amino-acid hydrolase
MLDDLKELRTFGATTGPTGDGVVRPSLSAVDMAARRWLQDKMTAAGLESRIDGVGNVFGRSPASGKALLIGSHSDTQPTGGWLDGALGVVYGLEIARAFLENPETRDLPVDAVAWIDEEGTFLGCLGSKAFCGDLDEAAISGVHNLEGVSLTAALGEAGLAGLNDVERYDARRHMGYLEAHIEQGPYLERDGLRIGAVTSIVGIRGGLMIATGQQNHAGTTPMNLRRDAGMGLIHLAHELDLRFKAIAGDRTVWTFGRMDFEPGAPSIVPGRAEMLVQFRDSSDERLDAFEETAAAIAKELSGEITFEFTRNRAPVRPTMMEEAFVAHIEEAARQRVPDGWIRMPSAAGHDPMVLSYQLPCGMLFIPSIGGVSHDFAEDSHDADIVTGCEVLADAAEAILREVRR